MIDTRELNRKVRLLQRSSSDLEQLVILKEIDKICGDAIEDLSYDKKSKLTYLNKMRDLHIHHVYAYLKIYCEENNKSIHPECYTLITGRHQPAIRFISDDKSVKLSKIDSALRHDISFKHLLQYLKLPSNYTAITNDLFDLFVKKTQEDETYPNCLLSRTIKNIG